MKHRTTIAALLAAATLFAVPALAAKTGTYSYLSGQQQSTARHGQFEGLSGLMTDEERAAFFSGNETGGDEGSDLQLPLDTAALVEAGVIDIPFAPSRFNKNKMLPARDHEGAIRILDAGGVPFSKDILDFHRQKMEERAKFEGRQVSFQMVIDDVYAIGKGRLVGRPRN